MERRQRIVLIVAGLLVLVGILVLVLRTRGNGTGDGAPTTPAGSLTPSGSLERSGGAAETGEGTGVSVLMPTSTELAVRQLAVTFAERYGSFSTEGNFVNITDLYSVVTERYARELEQDVARERAKTTPATFRSTTTIAIGVTAALDGGDAAARATVTVTTRRTEIVAGTAARTFTQPITITLAKISEGWRVDRAAWGTAIR